MSSFLCLCLIVLRGRKNGYHSGRRKRRIRRLSDRRVDGLSIVVAARDHFVLGRKEMFHFLSAGRGSERVDLVLSPSRM